MYLFRVAVKPSSIEGKGVFADEDIPKNALVWRFDPKHDQQISWERYQTLSEEEKIDIRKVGYISPTSGDWIFPPANDPARYTNHSSSMNNLSAVFDPTSSPEPFFIARSDIRRGDELVVNYSEFDASIKTEKPEWMKSAESKTKNTSIEQYLL
jgi:SET domain-containing protein